MIEPLPKAASRQHSKRASVAEMRPNMDGNLPPKRVWFRYASFARYSTSGEQPVSIRELRSLLNHRYGGDESACKPGFVVGDHLSKAARCRVAQATYPGTSREQRSGGVRSRRNRPSWSCSRWGLPSRPSHLGRWGSLTPPFHPYPLPGGLFSVALSRGSPRVGVTHHLALRSPDFPQPCIRAAITRPTRPTGHSIGTA